MRTHSNTNTATTIVTRIEIGTVTAITIVAQPTTTAITATSGGIIVTIEEGAATRTDFL